MFTLGLGIVLEILHQPLQGLQVGLDVSVSTGFLSFVDLSYDHHLELSHRHLVDFDLREDSYAVFWVHLWLLCIDINRHNSLFLI